ncbi:tripartite tricarboxylate transporter substrate binding protein [Paramixta manurensis]|uniref:Tripartite tricarboxylate transporter substrate binding protein n=2 Tax=Paramixta manurensis TaxID=2740817 RepID=A0A6M8UJX6_9GAMM|nr:tripartite tricarboxylate transporter substrate binding protein [Erwiniaceae bacterium PD-1]
MKSKTLRPLALMSSIAFLAFSLVACDKQENAAIPNNVQMVVDTGPGGGSDLFAREIVKIAQQAHVLDQNWPVLSKPQGGGLAAMNFLNEHANDPNYISAFTSKWVSTGFTAGNKAATTVDKLTVIAMLADEQQLVAVPAKSPYNTFADFIADAKKHPGQLVQVGGAYQSVDNLAALQIQKNTGTSWKYLSFADGGPRITALLRGDAQMMIGAQNDFSEQVAAGQLKIIGVLSSDRNKKFPNVSTLIEQGVPMNGVPDELQFRGIAAPPGVKPETIAWYQNIFSKLVKSPEWEKYMAEEGDRTQYVTGDALKQKMSSYTTDIKQLVTLLKEKN